jgi:hypothetical protein
MNSTSPSPDARPINKPLAPTLAAQIAGLHALPFKQLQALWRQYFCSEPPTHNRQFLERHLAHKIQEQAYRLVNPDLLVRNQERIAALLKPTKTRARETARQVPPGTTFTRHYQGRDHQVTASADGQFVFEGRPYRSLSMIAREITGSRWSGPVFFGLKDYAAKKSGKDSSKASSKKSAKVAIHRGGAR